MNYTPINLDQTFGKFAERWSPKVIAEMNDYQFKLVKMQGEFVWHSHADTDEVFLVVHGEMEIGVRDPARGEHAVAVREGEMYVIPRGIEHITRARQECHALIIEPRGVVNTGDAASSLTADNDVWA